jgi:vesicle coat complex subunit
MNDCNEWGVIYTLDALALYTPEDSKEAEAIIERVCPRLAHSNPGVVLSACKIMMRYLDFLNNPEVTKLILYFY